MATTQWEQVEALDIQVGDKIQFPNSRHSQEVIDIKRHDDSPQVSVTLVAEGTEWTMPLYNSISRELVVSDEGEPDD